MGRATIAAAMIGAASLGAELSAQTLESALGSPRLPLTTTSDRPLRGGDLGEPVSASAVAAQYRVVDSLANAFSFYNLASHPYTYDGVTNTFAFITRGPVGSSNNLYVRYSNDMGMTWSAPLQAYDATQGVGPARYPSVRQVTIPGATDPNEFGFLWASPILVSGAFGGMAIGLVAKDGTALPAFTDQDGINGNLWSSTSKLAVSNDDAVAIVVASLSNNNLGMLRVNVAGGVTSGVTEMIPDQWSSQNFTVPTGEGSTVSLTDVGVDDNNNFYVGVHARFDAQEVSRRLQPYPAVSVSNDLGMTWSPFDPMPINVLTDYVAANGGGANPDSTLFTYSAEDMVVEGDGTVHFLLSFYQSDASLPEEDPQFAHLVEVTRTAAGAWSMTKVADISGRNFLFVSAPADTSSQVDNEVQIGVSADGTKLLAKWVDIFTYTSPNDLDGDGISPDTVATSDVLTSVRTLAGGTWSMPKNVTETVLLDKLTWITEEVPNDLTNYPLLSVQSIVTAPTSAWDSLFFQQRVVDVPAYIVIANVDMSASVNGVQDVATTSRSGMRLNAPVPNPTRDRALVTFTLPSSGRVALEIFAVDGTRISTLHDGMMEEGDHVVALPSSELAAGSYYYTLRSNGETLTRMFTVVR